MCHLSAFRSPSIKFHQFSKISLNFYEILLNFKYWSFLNFQFKFYPEFRKVWIRKVVLYLNSFDSIFYLIFFSSGSPSFDRIKFKLVQIFWINQKPHCSLGRAHSRRPSSPKPPPPSRTAPLLPCSHAARPARLRRAQSLPAARTPPPTPAPGTHPARTNPPPRCCSMAPWCFKKRRVPPSPIFFSLHPFPPSTGACMKLHRTAPDRLLSAPVPKFIVNGASVEAATTAIVVGSRIPTRGGVNRRF
jgi:hypothetical protein